MEHADIYRLFTSKDGHILIHGFESAPGNCEMQLLTLKMPQTDFLKVRKCVFVEKKVTVMAASVFTI